MATMLQFPTSIRLCRKLVSDLAMVKRGSYPTHASSTLSPLPPTTLGGLFARSLWTKRRFNFVLTAQNSVANVCCACPDHVHTYLCIPTGYLSMDMSTLSQRLFNNADVGDRKSDWYRLSSSLLDLCEPIEEFLVELEQTQQDWRSTFVSKIEACSRNFVCTHYAEMR
eukprot:2649163-Pyramimonas_sp.AAC.1